MVCKGNGGVKKNKMSKLQMIKRSNQSKSYSVNIPLNIIEELEWEKGMELFLDVKKDGEKSILLISDKEIGDNYGQY